MKLWYMAKFSEHVKVVISNSNLFNGLLTQLLVN